MPRRKTLTDAAIAKLPPRSKSYTVPDPELPGHYLRVRPTSAKTFVAVARDPNGKQVWHTIGAASLYTVTEARQRAREAIKAIRSGSSRDGVETFEAVAEQWFKRHVEAKGLISAPGESAPQKTGLRCWRDGTPGARVSAAIALLDRAYGKAPTFSTSDTQAFKRAIDMTDDELAAIASRAHLTVIK